MVLFVVDRENSATGRVCHDQHKDDNEKDGQGNQEPVQLKTDQNESFRLAEYLHNNQTQYQYHPLQGLKVNTVAGLLAGCIQVILSTIYYHYYLLSMITDMQSSELKYY